jgi:hypothetical protein
VLCSPWARDRRHLDHHRAQVPPRRLVGLATYGLSSKAAQLRRLVPPEYQMAVLVATVKVLIGRATDDVLELFDLLMVTDLYSNERESKGEKLRRYPRVSRHAGKLAAAVKVLLEMTEVGPELSLEMICDHIENAVTKSELRSRVRRDPHRPGSRPLVRRWALGHHSEGPGIEARRDVTVQAFPTLAGHHRAPVHATSDRWLCLATQVLEGWAPTLRVCMLLAVTGAVVTGVILSTGPAIGAPVGTVVTGVGLLASWRVARGSTTLQRQHSTI